MKSIKKHCISLFIFSMISSLMFVCGIPFIIMGAKSNKILMIVGIIFTVWGFYGSPILWINFAQSKRLLTIYEQVTIDKILSASQIALNNNQTIDVVTENLKTLLQKRFLTGYIINEKGELSKFEGKFNIINNKCPTCGANMERDGDKLYCSYCNNSIIIHTK